MSALQVMRGGEDHALEFLELIIFAFDGLQLGRFHATRPDG